MSDDQTTLADRMRESSTVVIISGVYVTATGYDNGDPKLMLAGVFCMVCGWVIRTLFEE